MARKRGIAIRGASAARSGGQVAENPITLGVDGSILINLSKAEDPGHVYDADFAWLGFRHGAVSLWFAKESLDQPTRLRSRLELRYPAEAFGRIFWKDSREFHEKLREWFATAKFPPDSAREGTSPEQLAADVDASMWVNVDVMARSGTQASIDFYHLPPNGLARYRQGLGSDGLVLTPKVRVLTTVHELIRLLDSAENVMRQISSELPKGLLLDEDDSKV